MKIFFPLEMIFTCNWRSANNLTIKGDFGKIFLNIANNMNEVSVRGVLEYLGQQYKYSTILAIREKMFTVTFQEPSKELYDVVMKVKMLTGFPMLVITGNIPTFQYFTAGDFKTEVIVNSWLNYDIKHTFHGVEMLRLTVDMLNGFPKMEITGNVQAFKYLTAGTFKTEVIVHSWEEARQMADAHPSAVGEPYGMKVGAASKGIIQRDFQHHATVFKSPYAKNPFDSVSNEELEEYKRIINKKNKGDSSPASPVLEEDTIGDTTDPGEHTNYEEETDGNRTFSEGEGDTSRATDPDSALSPKKEKKKKGLRTPSFLKKKKKDKKEKEKA